MPAVQVPTVVLRHRVGGGSHLDWMVQKPGAPGAIRTFAPEGGSGPACADDTDLDARVLATWRMGVEPGDWEAGESYEAERIGDHRRVYLVYQGELSDGRGEVERIDAGVATVVSWEEGEIVLEVEMRGFVGRVEASESRGHPGTAPGSASPGFRWEVRVLERRGGGGMMR